MHDVLDPRDQVPDEAEQLLHSGYAVDGLLRAAREASRLSDLSGLAEIANSLTRAQRSPDWPYEESSESSQLTEVLTGLPVLAVDHDAIADRIHGAWLGRCVGNTLGKPVEGLTREEVGIYLRAVGQWPQTGYIPMLDELPAGVSHLHESAPFASAGRFKDVPRDDDLDWTILGLAMIEEHGEAISTEDIARAWLDCLPFTQTFTAERVAYRNLIRGIPVDEAARIENPYREWIGALIRADIFGYIHPGDPAAAARLALVDARLSHLSNGIYGEMWAAALVASGLAVNDAREALGIALRAVPRSSRLWLSQQSLLALYDDGTSADDALQWIDRELGQYNWVHTVNNAALISLGLLWGSDFTSAVTIAIAGGRDTDSTAATVGSVYGALHGLASIPEHLVGTTHIHVRSAVRDFDRIRIAELAERTMHLAGRIVAGP
jgi:ADP-ribosylglycohydrolase